ncbi:MAG: M56 family metallopeptidase [Gemmatimonadota bacterium]|nr:M56 family metallopeptidase [Gemmatimonadota bacterium]
MLCILYVNLVGTCLGLFGLLTERVLPTTWPRRWMWCAIIAISIFLPGYYRFHHTWSVIAALDPPAAAPASHAMGTPSLSVLDADWWAHTRSYDRDINRVWLTASAVLIVLGLANAWRVWRIVHHARRRRGAASRPTVVDGVPVVLTDSLGPATVGLWRTRVLVPRWVLALPGVQRRYVLHHEDEHRSAHDAHLLLVASLTLLLMPWNLALWWLQRRLRLAVEMDCDNRVVSALGNPVAYGELLLKVAQAASRGPRLQPALLGGVGMLEHRLTVLLAPTPLRHVQRFLLPAMALGLLFVVLSMPHPVLGARSKAPVGTPGAATTHHSTQSTEASVAHR